MHTLILDDWRHDHIILGSKHDERKHRTWFVVGLTSRGPLAHVHARRSARNRLLPLHVPSRA